MDHGEHVIDGHVDVLAGLGVGTDPDGGSPDQRPDIVGLDGTELGGPGNVVLVGEEGGGDRGTVVTTDTDQHQAVFTTTRSAWIPPFDRAKSTHPTLPTLVSVLNSYFCSLFSTTSLPSSDSTDPKPIDQQTTPPSHICDQRPCLGRRTHS